MPQNPNPTYPLFAFEKDDSSMFKIETFDRVLYYCERIDIENNEYIFWDATGSGVCVAVEKGRIARLSLCEAAFPLSAGFMRYLEANKLPRDLQTANPVETWDFIQAELSRRPKRRGFLSRLFQAETNRQLIGVIGVYFTRSPDR